MTGQKRGNRFVPSWLWPASSTDNQNYPNVAANVSTIDLSESRRCRHWNRHEKIQVNALLTHQMAKNMHYEEKMKGCIASTSLLEVN